jgi:hypothetical protein
VSEGSQLGENTLSPPGTKLSASSNPNPPHHFASPNRFQSLAPTIPDYQPLAYVDVEVSAPDSGESVATRALVHSGGQGSFISHNLAKTYNLPQVAKTPPVTLILADREPSPHTICHYSPLCSRRDRMQNPALSTLLTPPMILFSEFPGSKSMTPRYGSEAKL